MWVHILPWMGVGFVLGVGATTAAWMFLELKNAPEMEDPDIRPLHFTAEPLYEDVEPYAKIIERKEDEA